MSDEAHEGAGESLVRQAQRIAPESGEKLVSFRQACVTARRAPRYGSRLREEAQGDRNGSRRQEEQESQDLHAGAPADRWRGTRDGRENHDSRCELCRRERKSQFSSSRVRSR
ncbi:MAG: hypothetical protein HY816_06205 [Candidatus Wallbacteria bacterium]|nr:hypothetical protein [Candidatus Wallbacteria bacterium]